jgi:hypothetical protein
VRRGRGDEVLFEVRIVLHVCIDRVQSVLQHEGIASLEIAEVRLQELLVVEAVERCRLSDMPKMQLLLPIDRTGPQKS